jgi:uncharacterized membrane protein
MRKFYDDYLDSKIKPERSLFVGIVFLVVVISGVFGWTYEFIFYWINSGFDKFYWRGGNFLPWINIYAYGSLMIWSLTFKLRRKPLLVFIISFVSAGILEFSAGLGVYLITGQRYWDYDTEILGFGSIYGFVCLRSVVVFGLMGLLLVYVILPGVYYLAVKLPKKVFIVTSVILFTVFLGDDIYNLIFANLFSLPNAHDVYRSIGFNFMDYTR